MSYQVAIDTGAVIGPRTGIGVAVHELLSALQDRPDAPRLQPYVLSFRAPLADGIRRLPLPAAAAHRLWSVTPHPRVDRFLGHPAVIHGTNYVVPPARAAQVVTVYDCWFLRHPEGVHPDVARAGRVLLASIERGATVHVSSAATAQALREFCTPRRVEIIHLGTVPLPPAGEPTGPLAKLAGRPYVLGVGTIERRKNVPGLLRAFSLLAPEEPDLDLVLAGADGNDSDAANRLISAMPPSISSRVHVLGRIDEAAKSWLVRNARCLAYPSLDEGFGFPLLEAMGVGTPVVASAVGSIPEVAGNAALLVAIGDDAALAAALARAHRDETTRDSLIIAGFERGEAFSWSHTAAKLISLYDALAMEHIR